MQKYLAWLLQLCLCTSCLLTCFCINVSRETTTYHSLSRWHNCHAICKDLGLSLTDDQWKFLPARLSTQQSNPNPNICVMCPNKLAPIYQGHMESTQQKNFFNYVRFLGAVSRWLSVISKYQWPHISYLSFKRTDASCVVLHIFCRYW